ncbi:MAG: hypothetical protein OEY06_04905 [Gammaproteobacteria bacterium]|nr:hypothetical protein [Gammaproteobacteria bacterium]
MRDTVLPITMAFLLLLTFSLIARAESEFSLTPSLMHFDYTEFSYNGTVLDRETGWVPGIQFQLAHDINDQLNIELGISTYGGNVDYAGHTQSGLPHNTRTNEGLTRIDTRFIAPLLPDTNIYLATKFHQWDRNIYSNNGVAGIFEQYQWWEISVGGRISFWIKNNQAWIADIAILRTINPTLYVDLSSVDAGNADLNLGSDTGARLQLMWEISTNERYTYGINTFYEIWDFGISDTKNTTGGSSSFSIFEPRSETRHIGIQFQLNFKH